MYDLTGATHHPAIEEIAEVLTSKTQNDDRRFFRTEVAYFLCKMAACMRATVVAKNMGEIPVNLYAVLLGPSGSGKGRSIGAMEDDFLFSFRKRYMDNTFPQVVEAAMWKAANDRAVYNSSDPQDEFNKLEKSFRAKGPFPFTFDSGSIPAIKQLREKLLIGTIGAINYQVDEIGMNLTAAVEPLTVMLELFDQGKTKLKLTKQSTENERSEDLDGKTPANMLLFGTPSKLLDGGETEDKFCGLLETGYARRCIFASNEQTRIDHGGLTPAQIYQKQIQPSNNAAILKWSTQFHKLADPQMVGWKIKVDDAVAIELLTYKLDCEERADQMAQFDEIARAEMSHRYFKALKIAGALAFVDESSDLELHHLKSAILLVEESGEAFSRIITRDKNYVRLAKYIADVNTEVTQSDLVERLSFYRGTVGKRNEMMSLAMSWGYKNHIIVKKSFIDGIEFFKGETLEKTELDKVTISYSDNFAYDYTPETVPFDQLHLLTQEAGMHWANHHFKGGHRHDDMAIPGFNLVVVDCDGDVSLDAVHELLKDYQFLTYTTKRHTQAENRFRLIMPINYRLYLDQEEYREFMNGVLAWLPFNSDAGANQRAKKWESFDKGTYHYNEGQLLDALDFIPKTSRNEAFKEGYKSLESLDNLERWFAQRIAEGNRNNQMIKYALALVDGGMDIIQVRAQVIAFNAKLNNGLSESEIDSTIMVTVARKLQPKEAT